MFGVFVDTLSRMARHTGCGKSFPVPVVIVLCDVLAYTEFFTKRDFLVPTPTTYTLYILDGGERRVGSRLLGCSFRELLGCKRAFSNSSSERSRHEMWCCTNIVHSCRDMNRSGGDAVRVVRQSQRHNLSADKMFTRNMAAPVVWTRMQRTSCARISLFGFFVEQKTGWDGLKIQSADTAAGHCMHYLYSKHYRQKIKSTLLIMYIYVCKTIALALFSNATH